MQCAKKMRTQFQESMEHFLLANRTRKEPKVFQLFAFIRFRGVDPHHGKSAEFMCEQVILNNEAICFATLTAALRF